MSNLQTESQGGISTQRLVGRVALITGGASGQGLAEAKLFASHGATVVIADLNDEAGQREAQLIGSACSYFHLDVADENDWATVVAEVISAHGSIDILVNNAGIFQRGDILTGTREVWDRTIAINQTGVYLGMRAVSEQMVRQKGGSIINISSVAGLTAAAPFVAYSASKWAVRGMTKSVALTLAPHQVRVNSVHPGIIDTPMLSTFTDAGGTQVLDALESRIPMGRFAESRDVADIVLFLASDDSKYCTGSEFVVDGGFLL